MQLEGSGQQKNPVKFLMMTYSFATVKRGKNLSYIRSATIHIPFDMTLLSEQKPLSESS
jgi:hypothetical protein